MDPENTEQVAITDLVVDDVVLNPEKLMWMRVVRVKRVTETIHVNERGVERSEAPRSLLRITLDPVHRLKVETFIPYYLDRRDIEQLDTITRWKGGDPPPQLY